jgi:DNA-binding beta-propeller fold protein YncE
MIHGNKTRAFLLAFLLVMAQGASLAAFPFSGDTVRFERARDHFRKGMHFFNKKQYLAAVEFFRNAVGAYSDYHTAREFLARSYRYAGFTDEALKEWETLSELNPENVYIRNRIDTLRFRKARGSLEQKLGDVVMSGEVISSRLNRFRFPNPVDCAVDEDKNLYITSFSLGRISKIDPNGNGIASYTPSLKSMLYGIDTFGGRVAVSDYKQDRVYLLGRDLGKIKTFGNPGSGDGQFHGPMGLSYDKNGSLYVVDSGNNRVQKFDEDGNFILKFGEPGDDGGCLDGPTAVAALKDRVYITDTGNKRIACFDDSGNFVKNITVDSLTRPRGISTAGKHVLVSDEAKGLFIYDLENGTDRWFNEWNNGERKFSRLYSARYDRDGVLYGVDYGYERVFLFSPPQIQYSNLDLEITSVDTRSYPTVAVYFNVRGRNGLPVYGLTRDNFRVTEDGMSVAGVSVDYLKVREPSASIVLCLDRSQSVSAHHNEMPWVSEFILERMRKNDSIKVMNFNRDFWTGNDFDWSRRRSLQAIGKKDYRLTSDYGNALYNAVNDLLPKLNRRAVVMVTDGAMTRDSFKKYSPEYIIEYAKSHYIPVYVVTFRDGPDELRKIARETGGDLFRASDVGDLRGLYDRIKKSEEYRYLLLYRSYKLPAFRGWWSDLHISVDYRGQKGVEWGGYFAPAK